MTQQSDVLQRSRSARRLAELLESYDWGCIWCEEMYTDSEAIHDHEYSFDDPLCPECHEDMGPADSFIRKEVLP